VADSRAKAGGKSLERGSGVGSISLANREIRGLSLCALTSLLDVLLVLVSGEKRCVVYAGTNTRHRSNRHARPRVVTTTATRLSRKTGVGREVLRSSSHDSKRKRTSKG
jgi:hypothetical protein